LPALSPATSRTADRHEPKADKTLSSLRPAGTRPQLLQILDRRVLNMINQPTAQRGAAVGEDVDHLHHQPARAVIQVADPVTDPAPGCAVAAAPRR
jgi:hypothetical protein